MSKAYEPKELASRIFVATMACTGAFIAAVFIFIL